MEMIRIALVGTPGAGKTSVMRILKKSVCPSGYGVGFVDEAATMLMRSNGEIRRLRETDPVAFQDMVARTHTLNEAAGVEKAKREGYDRFMQITDRALHDAYVYLNDEQRRGLKYPVGSIEELNERYDAVLCFDYYGCGASIKAGNDLRAEKALSDIKRVCERSVEVYSTHKRFYLIPPYGDIYDKAARVAEIINEVAMERVFSVSKADN